MLNEIWIAIRIAFWLTLAAVPFLIYATIQQSIKFKNSVIKSAELIDIRSRTYTKNATGRMIMGQLTGGDMGALLGALTAKQKTEVTYVFRVVWGDGHVSSVECHYNDEKYRRFMRLDGPETKPDEKKTFSVSLSPQANAAETENARTLIMLGELREGTLLKMRTDCNNGTVEFLSSEGKPLGSAGSDFSQDILDRFSRGAELKAASSCVDYKNAKLLSVSVTEVSR